VGVVAISKKGKKRITSSTLTPAELDPLQPDPILRRTLLEKAEKKRKLEP